MNQLVRACLDFLEISSPAEKDLQQWARGLILTYRVRQWSCDKMKLLQRLLFSSKDWNITGQVITFFGEIIILRFYFVMFHWDGLAWGLDNRVDGLEVVPSLVTAELMDGMAWIQ